MKINKLRTILATGCMVVAMVAAGQKSKNPTYDTHEWQTVNQNAMQQLVSGQGGNRVSFTPCFIENDFVASRCKLVDFYDCMVYFDPAKRAVIFADDATRDEFYVIFDHATSVIKGAGSHEIIIECCLSPTRYYDVVYNVRTNQAVRMDNADPLILTRFETQTPKIFYMEPRNKMTREYHDYFKALTDGDYTGAQGMRKKFIQKANGQQGIKDDRMHWEAQGIFDAYPLMELGEAMIMSYPADYSGRKSMSIERDPIKGYQYIRQIFRHDTLLDQPNAVLLSGDIRMSVEKIKNRVEEAMYEDAHSQGTEAAYDRLLAVLYNSPIRSKAQKEQENIAYGTALASQSTEGYLYYLNKYRSGDYDHYQEIEQKLFKMAYDQMPHTSAGCREYLKRYGLSPYADEVRNQLSEFAYTELEPTAASCREFIDNFPRSPHVNDVWFKLFEYAYNELGDDLEKCEQYLQDYPTSGYCDQVQRKIIKIKYDQACAQNTYEAYDAFLKETAYNTYTTDVERRRSAIARGQSTAANDEPQTEHPAITTTKKATPKKTAAPAQAKKTTPAQTTTKPAANQQTKKSSNNSKGKMWDLD